MKRLLLIVCFVVVFSPKIYSQLLVENFEMLPLTPLAGQNGWIVASSGINPILVTLLPLGGLTYPNYAGSGLGNAVTLLTSGEDDAKPLTVTQTTGSIYTSFMLNMISTQTTGDYFLALRTTGSANDSRVYARPDGLLGFNLGIEKAAGSGVVYASPSYSFLTTYLVVVKYTFVAGPSNDQMSLFVFDPSSPPPAIEPTPTLGPITFALGVDAVDLNDVLLRQGSASLSPNLIIDGIYVDASYNNSVLPVELSSFTSAISNRDVTLNWMTISEVNNSTFEIEKSQVNTQWSTIGSVRGNGTTNNHHNYTFTDRGLASGKYNYRLKQIDYNGNFAYFNLSNEVEIGIPSKYEMSQNYPNPFNPSTKINYDLPFDGNVSIKLFNMVGIEVATVVNNPHAAGYYTISFDASSLSSGIYFYRIFAEGKGSSFISTKKLTLVK